MEKGESIGKREVMQSQRALVDVIEVFSPEM